MQKLHRGHKISSHKKIYQEFIMNGMVPPITASKFYVPGRGSKRHWKKLQNPGSNSGRLKIPLCFTASLSSFHLSAMSWWQYPKKFSLGLAAVPQLSETTFNTFAARSCESLDTPMVLSSMYLTIFSAIDGSLTRAQLQNVEVGIIRDTEMPRHLVQCSPTCIFHFLRC